MSWGFKKAAPGLLTGIVLCLGLWEAPASLFAEKREEKIPEELLERLDFFMNFDMVQNMEGEKEAAEDVFFSTSPSCPSAEKEERVSHE